MNNLKKFLSVIVVVAMLVTIMVPAFAEGEAFTYTAEAQKLNDLGLFKGVAAPGEAFNPDLGTALNRETGVVMLLRIFGLESEAAAITDADATLAKFSDADSVSDWAKNAVAYAVTNGLVQGYPDGTFGPKVALNGKAYATLILRQLGYTPDYNNATSELADKGGLTPEEATMFAGKELIRDDLVGMSFGTLSAVDSEGKTVIETLVEKAVVDETVAVDAGLVTPAATPTPEPVVSALDVKSASSINSKVVEVILNTAAKAEDVAAATFKVADAAAKEVVVTSAELAAYNTDSKAVLVTLEADTTAGTLYTLTTGTKSVNFGGKAVDTTKPEIPTSGVTSNDYNQVKVTFKEPVKLDGATIVVTEKYGTKASLQVTDFKYDGKDTIVFTTADQKDATLYGVVVSGVKDFAGNEMDKDDAKTFVGQAKSTDALKVMAAGSTDYNAVAVKFNKKVDPETLKPEFFTLAETYGTKVAIEVTAVKLAVEDDLDEAGVAIASDDAGKYYAILTVGTMKSSTLYKLTAKTGLKTLYGKDLSTTESETYKTFVGQAKPSTDLEFGATPAAASSNTTIDVSFARKVDKTLAETIANYTIAEAYGSKAALEVKAAELKSDGKTVKLTVASMKNLLYKMTVSSIKDVYGNALKTSSDYNIKTFVGSAVAAKIESFTAAVDATDNTKLVVIFNKPVGTTAKDVSHYTIDNSIGYPESVETDDSNSSKVTLTIPKTVDGKTYKLTVKGLENSDGVAMATDGISGTFVGRGVDPTKPKIEAVMPIDEQTLALYFDRSVKDASVKGATGRVYKATGNGNATNGLTFSISKDGGTTWTYYTQASNNHVATDSANANELILKLDPGVKDGAFNKSNLTGTNTFKIKFDTNVVYSTDSANIIAFASNESDCTQPELTNIVALDTVTIRAYFSADVKDVVGGAANFRIHTASGAANSLATTGSIITSVVKVDDKTYDLVHAALTGGTNNKYFLKYNNNTVSDLSGYTKSKNDDSTTANTANNVVREFANSSSAAENLTSGISVFMPDKRTIQVYYPEAMDTTTLDLTALNFFLRETAATAGTEVKLVGDFTLNKTNAYSTYDSDTNVQTIYLKADLKASSSSKYHFGIKAADVKNAAGTKFVSKEATTHVSPADDLYLELANSTTTAPKPAIASASVDDARRVITVVFDTPVVFGAPDYANAETQSTANDILASGTTGAYVSGDADLDVVANSLKLTATFGDGTSLNGARLLDVDAVGGVVANISRSDDNKTVKITLSKALKAGTTATIKVDPTADVIYSYSSVAAEKSDADASKADAGVPSTVLYDDKAPVVTQIVSLDANADGSIDTLKVVFDEPVKDSTIGVGDIAAAAGANNGTLVAAGTVSGDAADDNVVYVTLGVQIPGTAQLALDVWISDIEDAYTNKNLVAAKQVFVAANTVDGAAPVAMVGAGTKTLSATSAQITFSETVVITTPAIALFAGAAGNVADSAVPAVAGAVVTLTYPALTFTTNVASVVDYAPLAVGNAANVKDAAGNEVVGFTDVVLAFGF